MNSTTYPRPPRSAGANAALGLSATLVMLTLLSGCGRRPIIVHSAPAPAPVPTTVIHTPAPAVAPQPVVGTASREIVVVKEAPPPPRDEPPPPPPPSSSYKWVPGYWSVASDGQREWIPGRYEMPPRASATWVPPRWERRAEGYVFVEGYWK